MSAVFQKHMRACVRPSTLFPPQVDAVSSGKITVLGSPSVDSGTRTGVQVICLGGGSRKDDWERVAGAA